jgi:hypothetical protein
MVMEHVRMYVLYVQISQDDDDDARLMKQNRFSHLLRIYIYVVLLLPMLLLPIDSMRMLFLSVLDVLVLLYRRGWPTS